MFVSQNGIANSFPTELDIMTGSTNNTSLGRSYLIVQPMAEGEGCLKMFENSFLQFCLVLQMLHAPLLMKQTDISQCFFSPALLKAYAFLKLLRRVRALSVRDFWQSVRLSQQMSSFPTLDIMPDFQAGFTALL